ncbi:hypothetical protein HDU89_003780 [Geranomyces variabilis]|nr:hypothetical protein HDU89_003780 [Geranomyces variabilis]
MVSFTATNSIAGSGCNQKSLPKGVASFDVTFSALPVLVNALRGEIEEPVASHPAYSMLVEGEIVVKCTKPMTFDKLEWVFLGQEWASFITYPGNHCQSGDRLRHASFTIFDTPTQLAEGETRYPLNFYIKPDYVPTLTTSFGGVRYGVACRLHRGESQKRSFMERMRSGPGSHALTTAEAELLVRRIVVRAEDLPAYSVAQKDGAELEEEADNLQVATAPLNSGVSGSVRVETIKRIVFLDAASAVALNLQVSLVDLAPGMKAAIKQVQYQVKEYIKCSATYFDPSSFRTGEHGIALSEFEKRVVLPMVTRDIGSGSAATVTAPATSSTLINLPIVIDAPAAVATWMADYTGRNVFVSHRLKVSIAVQIEGRLERIELALPVAVHGVSGSWDSREKSWI